MERTKKTINNFFWRFMERCGAQGVTFIVSVVLARLLDPHVYGTIALVTVFTTILQVFVDSGLGNALIQKKDADDTDFSTVFYFNLVMCCVLYICIFFCSPYIARFYKAPELTSVIRVLSIIVIISGVKNVQQAYVSRQLVFKKFFFATLGGTIGAAGIGIYMAYKGYGVWALVAQNLFNQLIDTVILWITVKWRPKWVFSIERLKGLFSYGWKILVAKLIDTTYNEVRQLIIGRMYTSEDLAFYNKGKQFPKLIVDNINTSIDSVLLPVMSREQDDKNTIKSMTRRSIMTSTFIIAPMMTGIAVCAKPLVRFILTDKWLPCVPYMIIFCITYYFRPLHAANLNAIKAVGRSDLFLKLEIAKKIVGALLLLSSMWFGVMAMALSLLISSVLSQIINSWPNKKILNYRYIDQIKDILPNTLMALFMGVCVYAVQLLRLPDLLTLGIQIPLGAIIYILGSKIVHLQSYVYVSEIVKGYIRKFAKRKE